MYIPKDSIKWLVIENIATMIISGLVVGTIAWVTHSLHCLWGLLILLNINTGSED